jgi:hypothetical protein
MTKLLNGKKGLIAITLVMAIILIGAFAPYAYVWKVSYKIDPLTENEMLAIPDTTGATSGDVVLATGSIKVDKAGNIIFEVPSTLGKASVEAGYWLLKFTVKIKDASGNTVGELWIPIVENGVWVPGTFDVDGDTIGDPAGNLWLGPGDYTVVKDVHYKTGAVQGVVSGSFTVWVRFEED